MCSVSIIYVNYKTSSLILDSIQTVKEKTKNVDYEVIVVDNNSGDQSKSKIQGVYPEVIWVQSDDNIGFGCANNLGLQVAKGKCVLFLNPDTLLVNDAISLLYHFLMSSSGIGACGGNLFDEEGYPTNSFSRMYPSFLWEFLSIFYLSPVVFPHVRSYNFNFTKKPIKVASVVGADLMVKRTVLDLVDGFDPRFFMNYEETELCRRIRKKGFDIFSMPDAQIIHLEGKASYIKQSRLSYLYEGQYIYFYKVYGYGGCLLIYLITQLKSYIRIIQFVLLANRKRLDYWKMKLKTNRSIWNSIKRRGFKR